MSAGSGASGSPDPPSPTSRPLPSRRVRRPEPCRVGASAGRNRVESARPQAGTVSSRRVRRGNTERALVIRHPPYSSRALYGAPTPTANRFRPCAVEDTPVPMRTIALNGGCTAIQRPQQRCMRLPCFTQDSASLSTHWDLRGDRLPPWWVEAEPAEIIRGGLVEARTPYQRRRHPAGRSEVVDGHVCRAGVR
jgi:hypothetical protein